MARKNVSEEKINAAETAENFSEEKENTVETEELSFSKQAFLSSKSYKPHRDLLATILEKGKSYRKSEVNNLIDNYLKGKVK